MKKIYASALYLALSAFAYADQPSADTTTQTQPNFIQYHNRIVLFNGFYQSYERTKNDIMYVGLLGYCVPVFNKDQNNMLLDTQFRMGYNFFLNGRDHVTPYAAVGFIENFYQHHRHTYHRPGIVYGALGFIYDHEFNSVVNFGFTGKLLVGGPVHDKRFDWGNYVIGTDFSLPFTLRFGRKRHWDYRIEPFSTFLHGSKQSQYYFGFRNSLGYRF